LQTSQGYIIRILQHFVTKLWNITNFVMLDQNFSYKVKGPLQPRPDFGGNSGRGGNKFGEVQRSS
jgi:hypothetical protein